MKQLIAILAVLLAVLTACGGDDGGGGFGFDDSGSDSDSGGSSGGSLTADIAPCDLFTDAELTAVLGGGPRTAEESEPAGPFTGCSWGTGDILISLATTDEPILAPGLEDTCPSADLGERSFVCEGRVTVLVGGIQYTVSTIDPFAETEHLVALAAVALPKLAG